jgi:nucleoside-diphosphate-sugar epimerase
MTSEAAGAEPMVESAVVVTGAAGLIGGALAQHLRGQRPVIGVDLRAGPQVDVVGDLASLPIGRILAGAEAVVHTAALHAPHVGGVDEAAFVEANVRVTERLLVESQRAGVRRFVFTSTTSVYGDAMDDPDRAVWVDESLEPLPRDIYDTTKIQAEALVAAAHRQDFATLTLRVARCFPEPWRTVVINRLHRGVDLRDVVRALELATEASPERHEVLNVAGPRIFDRSQLALLRSDPAAVLAAQEPWLVDEFRRRGWRLPISIDRVYVSDRAAEVLGYAPIHGAHDALSQLDGVRPSGGRQG